MSIMSSPLPFDKHLLSVVLQGFKVAEGVKFSITVYSKRGRQRFIKRQQCCVPGLMSKEVGIEMETDIKWKNTGCSEFSMLL